MSTHTLQKPILADILWRADRRFMQNALLAVAGSLALWVSAKIQIPFYPVPLTMQTFVVLVIGMGLGWRLGGATVLLYLAEGAVGLPVFAGTPEKGAGLAYMAGPTGGYLIGFVVAAASTGLLARRGWDRNILTTAAAMLVGNALIYIPGLLWLGAAIGWDQPILALGLTPFLIGDTVMLVLAAMALPAIWKFLGERTG